MSKIEGDSGLVIDLFAGGGGASQGISQAIGRSPDVAINHDLEAIRMHEENHPETRHYQESVFKTPPLTVTGGLPVWILWMSPDCTHFSRAKGGTPVKRRIRSLANIGIKWLRDTAPEILGGENVPEFLDWGPVIPKTDEHGKVQHDENGKILWMPDPKRKGQYFRAWRRSIERLGYTFDYRIIVAADLGVPTIRKRLFFVARRDGKPVQWPKKTHGKGRKQPWKWAAECIDFNDQGKTIFGRNKELALATKRRTARGILKHVLINPFIVNLTHGGRVESLEEPFKTITGANRGEKALVSPCVVGIDHRGGGDNQSRDTREPLGTVTKENRHAVIATSLLTNTTGHPGSRMDSPTPTICSGGHQAVVSASLIVGQGGSEYAGKPVPVDKPMGAVTKENHRGLVSAHLLTKAFTTTSDSQDVRKPVPTVTQQDHTGLVSGVLVSIAHGDSGGRRERALHEPFPTATKENAHAIAAVSLVQQQGKSIGESVTEPLRATTESNHFQLSAASLIRSGNGERKGQAARCEDIKAPLTTIPAGGVKQAVSLVKLRGTGTAGTVTEPSPAISAQGQHLVLSAVELISYYGTGNSASLRDPAESVTSKDRFALVAVRLDHDIEGAIRVARFLIEYADKPVPAEWIQVEGMEELQPVVFIHHEGQVFLMTDITLRMLRPRELARAQGFEDSYILTGTQSNQVAKIGNSVCPACAQAVVGANIGTWPVENCEPNLFTEAA